jgi:hypothetical protein
MSVCLKKNKTSIDWTGTDSVGFPAKCERLDISRKNRA